MRSHRRIIPEEESEDEDEDEDEDEAKEKKERFSRIAAVMRRDIYFNGQR